MLLELRYMGSRIIHYCVGNEILKRVRVDEYQFMLGNLAPDAYSPERGGSLVSHFRIPEEIMEYECVDLERFRSKYKHQIVKDFVLGYYCHLITDNLWLKDAYKKYGHLGHDERNEAVKLVYKDYWLLNTMLIDKFGLNLLDFQTTGHIPVDEIEVTFLNGLVENLGNDFSKKSDTRELKELNYDEILQFIDDAASKCIRGICMLRDI
jgi:hypothetical protein